ADAAGDPRRGIHALADPVLHRAAVRGHGAAGGDRHERPVLPRRRRGAGPGLPLVRLAAARPARRAVRDEGVQLLGRVPDGAVRLPAARPLAAAVAGAGRGAGAAARTHQLIGPKRWRRNLAAAADSPAILGVAWR